MPTIQLSEELCKEKARPDDICKEKSISHEMRGGN
jgi:hypothetical protein